MIRRKRSNIPDYKIEAKRFFNNFVQKGYSHFAVEKSVAQVENMNRDELLQYRQPVSVERITLALPYYHKYTDIFKVIHQPYKSFIKNFHDSKKGILELISCRRPKIIKDIIVKAHHSTHNKFILDKLPSKHSKSFISNLMNLLSVTQYPRTDRMCKIERGQQLNLMQFMLHNVESVVILGSNRRSTKC